MSSQPHALAVDLGGTNMRVALVDAEGTVLHRRVEPTPRDAAEPTALIELIRSELATAPDVHTAVVGVPGRVDHRNRRLEHAPNLPPGWMPWLTEERLSGFLGLPVALANDADLAAVGEAWFGAGSSYHDVVYITISTGIGAGVVLNKKLVHGGRSIAEVGHTIIDWRASADEPATLELLGAGTAMNRRAAAIGLEAKGAGVVELARAGDAKASAVWAEITRAAAVGITNLAQLFAPEVIVVGGGVGLTGDYLLDPARELVARMGPPGMPIKIVNATLGDQAGLAGAGAWTRAFVP